MPEGPEIRYLKEVLEKYILHKTLSKITAYSRIKAHIPHKSKVLEVGCKGKLLWIRTKDYYVHIHFGMTGWLYFNKDERPVHLKYLMDFGPNKQVYVESIRKFTKLKIYSYKEHDKKISRLGIDILTDKFTFDVFKEMISSKRMNICKFLLDQDKLCGIGNYQKSDVLYLSRIHPKENTANLDDNQINKLYKAIKYVAYSSLLTWLKEHHMKVPADIKRNMPSKTTNRYKFVVYDRERDNLGNKVTNETIGGRATYYVKRVQISKIGRKN